MDKSAIISKLRDECIFHLNHLNTFRFETDKAKRRIEKYVEWANKKLNDLNKDYFDLAIEKEFSTKEEFNNYFINEYTLLKIEIKITDFDAISRFGKKTKNEGIMKKSALKQLIKEVILNESASPIHKFVYFGYNFPSDFIEKVWEDSHLVNHLRNKFDEIYARVGAKAVFNYFYINLDRGNQQKLEDWIINNYEG